MSEIRERAQAWIKNETDSCWLFDCLGEEEGQQCVDAGYVIRDLLAELERVEGNHESECMECEKLATTVIRQQAARECVDEMEDYPTTVSVHATSHDARITTQTKNELVAVVKAHFGIKGE